MQVGDWVKLVRKYTGEPLVVTVEAVLMNGSRPRVEVSWRPERGCGVQRFILDLEKNLVIAQDGSQNHRQAMRAWYSVDEDDRKELTDMFWAARKTRRK